MLNFLTEIVNAGVSHVGFKDLFEVCKHIQTFFYGDIHARNLR